jgi:ADP-ribose pyrophosphatase
MPSHPPRPGRRDGPSTASEPLDDTRRATWSVADVELPDGVRFEQYVLRTPRPVIVAVVRDRSVLMLRRHRFVIDRWVWELPGGYVDDGEEPAAAAAREVEEETGWRPGPLRHVLSFQPMVGTADSENLLFVADGAQDTGARPDTNETDDVAWIPLATALDRIHTGEITGSASVIAILHLHRG